MNAWNLKKSEKSPGNKFWSNRTWMSPYKRSPGPGLFLAQTLCSKTPEKCHFQDDSM